MPVSATGPSRWKVRVHDTDELSANSDYSAYYDTPENIRPTAASETNHHPREGGAVAGVVAGTGIGMGHGQAFRCNVLSHGGTSNMRIMRLNGSL